MNKPQPRISNFSWKSISLRCFWLPIAAFLCLFFCEDPVYPQFRFTQWTADSGLPQNIIRGIAQTPDGYLWIATLNGVVRFDGVRFTVFNKSNTPGIAVNRFSMMSRGAPGDLWFYGEGGTVTRFRNGVFSTVVASTNVLRNAAYGITTDNQGSIWLLRGQHIEKWNEKSRLFEPIADDGIAYRTLNWDGTGFWGSRGQTLYCFHYGKLTTYMLPDSLPLTETQKVAVGGIGDVWLAQSNGSIARFFEGKWEIRSGSIERSFMDGEKRHWKTSMDSHLDRTIYIPTAEGEKAIRYNGFVEDDERNVWIGSEGQGLFRIQPQSIRMYTTKDGLVSGNIYPVLRDRHDDMWIGTWPAGLTRFHDGVSKTYTPKDGLPGLVSSLADDEAGNLWVGTHDGLTVLSKGKFQRPEGLAHDFPVIQAIFKDGDGSILFGTQAGLDRYTVRATGNRSLQLKHQESFNSGDVRVIIQGRNGDIWFGGYSGLNRLHGGVATHWTEKNGLPSNTVRAIYEDSQGVIWIGTYDGGLGRYADGGWTTYNQRNGLFDDGVFQILEDDRNNLWMSSNRGIFRVSKHQLEDVAAGRQSSVMAVSYGRNDGMQNVECNGGLWPAGAKDKQGYLWFPTQDGIAVVNPVSPVASGQQPRAVIESIELDHTPIDLQRPLTIHPGQDGLAIQYTALSFAHPEQIIFRYMMEGLDKAWEDVGYRRTAYFSHIPAGTYRFKVMAASSDGTWSREQSSLRITVLPPFYLTPWFLAMASGLLILAVYGFWIYRMRQLHAAQAMQQAFSQQLISSQENERKRIAAELHDSIGQRLVVIKNLGLFVIRPDRTPEEEPETETIIKEITEEASHAIEETRQISYNLRPFQLDRLGLTKAIEAMMRSVSAASGIQFTSEIDNIDTIFAEDLRINFYRIVQESLGNIMKHAEATEVLVSIRKTDEVVLLSISDNGRGFTPADAPPLPNKGGFGLIGLSERARLLGGQFKIQSFPGCGTHVTVEIPVNTPILYG